MSKDKYVSPVIYDEVAGTRTREAKFVITLNIAWPFDTDVEKEIFENLEKDTDRAVAVIAGSMIDIRLEAALRHRLRTDSKVTKAVFDFTGPLGTFSNKINLAYLMGIISKPAMNEAHLIRDIRNSFAHDLKIRDFGSQSIKDKVRNLKFADTHARNLDPEEGKMQIAMEAGSIPRVRFNDLKNKINSPRSRYLMCCSIFLIALALSEVQTDNELI